MDPYETLRQLLEAIRDKNSTTVVDAAYDLKHWLDRGGFSPIASVTRSALEDDSQRWMTLQLTGKN